MATDRSLPRQPAFRKGAKRTVEVSCVVWIDLLGYRSQIAAGAFNPLAKVAGTAIARVQRFHAIVADHSDRNFPTFALNDGAIAYRDLSPRSGSVGGDMIARAWRLFEDVLQDEVTHDQVGARMFLAAGFRAKRSGTRAKPTSHAESIWRRFDEGLLSPRQAIAEALHSNRYFDIVPDLQANFAFTRAYLADNGGATKNGLPGPAAYVDVALLPNPIPAWLEVGPLIPWTSDKGDMNTAFRKILSVSPEMGPPIQAFAGLDAVSVGERLTGDQNIKARLHAARLRRQTRVRRDQ